MVFLVLTLCRMVSLLQHFGGMCCHHLQSDWIWSRWMLKWLRRGSVSKFSFTRLEICQMCILKLWVGKGNLCTGTYTIICCFINVQHSAFFLHIYGLLLLSTAGQQQPPYGSAVPVHRNASQFHISYKTNSDGL